MNAIMIASLGLLRQIAEPILREDETIQRRVLDFLDTLISELEGIKKMTLRRDVDELQNELAKVQRDLSALIAVQNKKIDILIALFQELKKETTKELSTEPTGQER